MAGVDYSKPIKKRSFDEAKSSGVELKAHSAEKTNKVTPEQDAKRKNRASFQSDDKPLKTPAKTVRPPEENEADGENERGGELETRQHLVSALFVGPVHVTVFILLLREDGKENIRAAKNQR